MGKAVARFDGGKCFVESAFSFGLQRRVDGGVDAQATAVDEVLRKKAIELLVCHLLDVTEFDLAFVLGPQKNTRQWTTLRFWSAPLF